MKTFLRNPTVQQILVIFCFATLWIVASHFKWFDGGGNRMWFAEFGEVVKATQDIFSKDKFIHIKSSFYLILKAALIVVFLGFVAGFILGLREHIYKLLKLSIDFWRSIPPIIIIGILINLDSKEELYWRIWLVIFGAMPIIIIQLADSIGNSSKRRMLIFKSFKNSLFFRVRNVVIYEILPNLFSTVRTVVSFSIVIIIVSEMIYPPQYSIGGQIIHYQTASQIDYVYSYAFIVGLFGLLFNTTLRLLEKKVVYWK